MIIKVGTRGSELALRQANNVIDLLKNKHNLSIENFKITIIKTSGDIFLNDSLAKIGGKGLFTKEIEEKLLNKEIDLAVHSMKDMPLEIPAGLKICKTPKRDSHLDILLSKNSYNLSTLPKNSKVGTSSSRRKMQLTELRPDLEILPLRGNINTRIKKLINNDLAAIILAEAGIKRINLFEYLSDNNISISKIDTIIPAACQGALAIEIRNNDHELNKLIDAISDDKSQISITAERSFINEFNASCITPIAAFAEILDNNLIFKCEFFCPKGNKYSHQLTDKKENAEKIGRESAMHLHNKIKNQQYDSCN